MATISNTPQERIVLRAEARKSWALGLFLRTETGAAIDVTDAVITLVISEKQIDGTITPVINKIAQAVTPEVGYVRFNIQASELDLDPKDYATTITFRSPENYSLVLAKGETEIVANNETESADHDFTELPAAANMEVWLRKRNVIKLVAPVVYTKGNKGDKGDPADIIVSNIPPADTSSFWVDTSGSNPSFPDASILKVYNPETEQWGPIAGDSGIGIPIGGATNSILLKTSPDDYETGWGAPSSVMPPAGATINTYTENGYTVIEFVPLDTMGLDATDSEPGMVPRSIGADTWGWDWLTLADIVDATLDDISDTASYVRMTVAERAALADIDAPPPADWDAAVETPGHILNKPALGTAAAENVEAFRPTSWMPSLLDLTGVDSGTEEPVSGPAGTFFIVLPPETP